jgi:hypothetical protein
MIATEKDWDQISEDLAQAQYEKDLSRLQAARKQAEDAGDYDRSAHLTQLIADL